MTVSAVSDANYLSSTSIKYPLHIAQMIYCRIMTVTAVYGARYKEYQYSEMMVSAVSNARYVRSTGVKYLLCIAIVGHNGS